MNEVKNERNELASPLCSLSVGDWLIPQPYQYAMRVERLACCKWWDEPGCIRMPGYMKIDYTVFGLVARLPNLEDMRSPVGACSVDVYRAITKEWYRSEWGQRNVDVDAFPIYLKRVAGLGQLYLF